MNDHWLFELNTTIPYACPDNERVESKAFIFDTFEEARDSFRHELMRFAFEDNQLFDGNGHIKKLDDFLDGEIGKLQSLSKEQTDELKRSLSSSLFEMISGKDTVVSLSDNTKKNIGDNNSLRILIEPDEIDIYEKCDQYYLGRDHKLRTNAFAMTDKKNYWFRLYDFSGHCGHDCYPYIELELYKIEKHPERFEHFEVESECDEEQEPEPKYPCPVCGNITISTPGYFEICPECGWEDDMFVAGEEDIGLFANGDWTIRGYRANYQYIKQRIPEYRWRDGYNIDAETEFVAGPEPDANSGFFTQLAEKIGQANNTDETSEE